jgi:hypothetical protein
LTLVEALPLSRSALARTKLLRFASKSRLLGVACVYPSFTLRFAHALFNPRQIFSGLDVKSTKFAGSAKLLQFCISTQEPASSILYNSPRRVERESCECVQLSVTYLLIGCRTRPLGLPFIEQSKSFDSCQFSTRTTQSSSTMRSLVSRNAACSTVAREEELHAAQCEDTADPLVKIARTN